MKKPVKLSSEIVNLSDMINILEGVSLGSKFEMLMLESNLFG
jgi:hypothetical protein